MALPLGIPPRSFIDDSLPIMALNRLSWRILKKPGRPDGSTSTSPALYGLVLALVRFRKLDFDPNLIHLTAPFSTTDGALSMGNSEIGSL